jgi:SAM-dependent methyltransferase
MKLDIGCGRLKTTGFVGLDRFPLTGVDVVADLDLPTLPFRDDSFDLIYASHSLEHVADLQAAMKEVWRVGRPGAQVCIVAPYWAQGLNVANPYHKQVFNEHTPRFWTCAPTSPVDPAEYVRPPQGAMWGLAQSDNSNPGFDLRCLRMEFFYFQEYWALPPAERRERRRKGFDVCEQILYHLAVFKPPMTEDDLAALRLDFLDPWGVVERRKMAAAVQPRGFSLRSLLHRIAAAGRT